MNIKFGMDNFIVRYLKRFINHELDMPTSLLGEFDKNDLKQVIKYLNLPNVKTMFEVQKEIIATFPQLTKLFNYKFKDDYIIFTSKLVSKETSDFLQQNIDLIKEFCESVGWEIANIYDWVDISKDINGDGNVDKYDREILLNIINGSIDYPENIIKKADLNLDGFINDQDLSILDNYIASGKLNITIQQSHRKNIFPNKDMLVFINQFDGTFLYNYAIRDGRGDTIDDQPHPNDDGIYKVALYECTPGQKITIAHNNSQPVRLVIGGSPATLKSNIPNLMLDGVIDVELKAGDSIQYTCPSKDNGDSVNAHYVCIQCPSNYGNLSGHKTVTLVLDTGDINFDGKIDMEDYHLLARYTATGPGSEQYKWTPTEKQLAVMNVRKDDQSKEIDVRDAQYLYRFINGDPAIPSLGITFFDVEENSDYDAGNNVENLLIIDGHYDESVNIPFMDFVTDDWVIHDKFFNYLFGIAIHKYSESENITYLQELLKEYYPEHIYEEDFFYPGRFDDKMREVLKQYQLSKISYTLGDLNKDNQLTNADLIVLRNYIDDSANYTKVQKYLADKEKYPLTDEEILMLDRDGDKILTDNDLTILNNELAKKYSELLRSRADINDDTFVDEQDYLLLKEIVENGSANVTDEYGNIHNVTLKNYDIPFVLGWLDVQTEALLEKDVNQFGLISEVSK